MKKWIALCLAAVCMLSLTACGGAGASSSEGKMLVGRWTSRWNYTGDDDQTIAFDEGMEESDRFVDFFSDGTGQTNAYTSNDGDEVVVFEWEVIKATEEMVEFEDVPADAKVLMIYVAMEPTESDPADNNGYYVTDLSSWPYQPLETQTLKTADGETVYAYHILGSYNPLYVKNTGSRQFEDKRPDGYAKAWKSIANYKKDNSAYLSEVIHNWAS